MVFWIFVIMLVLGIFLLLQSDFEFTGIALTSIGGIVGVTMLIAILISNFAPEVKEKALKNQQESIIYKIESEVYKDDLNILDKDVIAEIKEWNTDVIYYKAFQRNFWIGIFIPNIYDEIEVIEYERVTK